MVLPSSLLESGGSVLEELLLPAIEYRRLEPQLVTQIRDRHSRVENQDHVERVLLVAAHRQITWTQRNCLL